MKLGMELGGILCIASFLGMPAALQADVMPLPQQAAISGSLIDFDALSLGWLSDPGILSSQGILFGNTTGLGVIPGSYAGTSGHALWDSDGTVQIQFTQATSAVGFDYSHLPSAPNLVLTAYGSNGILGSVQSSGASGYLGLAAPGQQITSVVLQSRGLIAGLGSPFNALEDRLSGPGRGGHLSFSLDNFSFGQATVAPVPGALLLALGGLGCVGLIRRRFI